MFLSLLMRNSVFSFRISPFNLGSRFEYFSYNRKVIQRRPRKSTENEVIIDSTKDRPFSLPPGEFKPKQSLGQNFLSDQNYVRKICGAMEDESDLGHRVVEIGPGAGALTRVLFEKYPKMTAIEIDQRSVVFLQKKLPGIDIIHKNVLEVDWPELALSKGGRLKVIGNLPYYIVSQVLFSLADSHRCIEKAVLTMQLEVAERITASPNTKDYGIPSVVFQLYCVSPKILFKIPPTVFYPAPKVDSALMLLDFTNPHPSIETVSGPHLRKVLSESFQQRRKMLRQSLKNLLSGDDCLISTLPDNWATLRPEQIAPLQFIELTKLLYGEVNNSKPESCITKKDSEGDENKMVDETLQNKAMYQSSKVWRIAKLNSS